MEDISLAALVAVFSFAGAELGSLFKYVFEAKQAKEERKEARYQGQLKFYVDALNQLTELSGAIYYLEKGTTPEGR